MIEVTQSRVGWGVGNCTEAVIASLLECSLEEVPDLSAGMDLDALRAVPVEARASFSWLDTPRTLHNDAKLNAWIKDRGYLWCFATFPELPLPLDFDRFAHPALPWDLPMMLGGPNPEGVRHLVVGVSGRVLWDPNPLHRGIRGCDEIGFLLPLDSPLLSDEQRTWPGLLFDFPSVPARHVSAELG